MMSKSKAINYLINKYCDVNIYFNLKDNMNEKFYYDGQQTIISQILNDIYNIDIENIDLIEVLKNK